MRILLVEDEKKIARAVKKGLEAQSFAVDAVHDGLSGYDMAATEDYDIVILDLMLPKLNGIEICRQLRSAGDQTPILMLTARGQLEDRVAGLNSGADDYLVKPFAFAELVARVKALARRPKTGVGPILAADDLTLNTITYQVTRADVDINLSRKEFALLEFLLRNKGHVLTKDQFIEHVWDYEAEILPNTVEVYIGYLRNKVDKAFTAKPPLIHTVRGFGYRLGEAE